jgi:ATP-dependent Clp protease ATP-binding subunit ClpC
MTLFARLGRPHLMNGYNFTERVRSVLTMAREEAARLHHEYVGTEHILLGLIREGEGVAAAVLQSLRVDVAEVRRKLEATIGTGKAAQATGPDLPYTSRAKKVLELAMAEARELNHSYVGTEHLLLGLLAEEKGIGAQVLSDVGRITLAQTRDETVRLLAAQPQEETAPGPRVVRTPPSPADVQREEQAWLRLHRALDVSARLGVAPNMKLEDDGSLTVSVGPDLVVSVDFPPHVRLRRADGPA